MKKLPLLLLLCLSFCLFASKAFSQDFLGLSTGNYSGVTGVMLQPAKIVDSRYKFDINLFSTDINYSNNYFLLDKNAILKFNKNKFNSYNTFKDRYLSEASLAAGDKVFFNINNRTQLPLSFMATTGKRSAIAFNMQFRTMIQGRGIDQNFAHLAFNNFEPSTLNPAIDASGISINSLSWAEAGFTYGRVIFSSGNHFLKAAVTGKYLAGLSSVSLSSNDLQMEVNGDSTFNFNSPNVSYNHNSNADFNKLFDRSFSPNANAIGFDAGLVYEYRGNIDKFKYIKSNDEKSYDALRRDVSKYIFKVGVSLLDVGMFRFDKPAGVNSFSADINNWDIKNAHYKNLHQFDTALARRVVANPNDSRSYNVYLPSALSAQVDVKFVKGLFLNIMSYWPVSLGSSEGERFNKYGFYTITPRYETRHFGIYIPYTVTQRNDLTDFKQHSLGATVRIGPLFIGSSNLGSMLFKRNLPAADVHIGLKVGFTYGKPTKSRKFLNSIFEKKESLKPLPETYGSEPYESEESRINREYNNQKFPTPKQSDNHGLILDYKKGKVYNNPDVKQNIIVINNNYYYGNAPAQKTTDTITVQNRSPKYDADSLQSQTLEMARQQNQKVTDSISKVTKDSLEIKRTQLDSLIKSMQQLKMQMDSNNEMMDSIQNIQDSGTTFIIKNLKATNDSLHHANDSLQNTGTSRSMIDTSRNRSSESLSATENLKASTSDSLSNTNDNLQKKNTLVNKIDTSSDRSSGSISEVERLKASNDSLQKVNDSLVSQRTVAANMTDTTGKANAVVFSGAENDTVSVIKKKQAPGIANAETKTGAEPAIVSKERNLSENDKMQAAQMERNNRSLQRIQDQQDELYKKYANQSARLASDIDRLNKKLDVTNRNTRTNTNYVPIPLVIPNNNSRRSEKKAETAPVHIRDTVYVRDTISIPSVDSTVQNLPADTVQQIIKIREIKRDTVRVPVIQKQPGFNYAEIPEENILFGLGKSAIQPIYNSRLNYIADILKKHDSLQVIVTGHTDATGSKAINNKLSLQRAEAVSFYLLNKGISKKQITVKSLSSEEPAVTGSDQAARSQNRRVSLKLMSNERRAISNEQSAKQSVPGCG